MLPYKVDICTGFSLTNLPITFKPNDERIEILCTQGQRSEQQWKMFMFNASYQQDWYRKILSGFELWKQTWRYVISLTRRLPL